MLLHWAGVSALHKPLLLCPPSLDPLRRHARIIVLEVLIVFALLQVRRSVFGGLFFLSQSSHMPLAAIRTRTRLF